MVRVQPVRGHWGIPVATAADGGKRVRHSRRYAGSVPDPLPPLARPPWEGPAFPINALVWQQRLPARAGGHAA